MVFSILFIAILSTFSACSIVGGNSVIDEEVKFKNPTDGALLAGTFSKPAGNGNFPTVILISGSGQQDRDETIYGHKPFKILAKYLNENDIAVLRFDDRGYGESSGDVWNATIDVLAADALSGIKYLKSRKDVNPNRIGIIGHSLGAMQGAMLASENPDIAFLIMLAGPGVPWAENLVAANDENLKRKGKHAEVIESGNRLLSAMIPLMQAGQDYQTTKAELWEVISKWKQSLSGKAKEEIEGFDEAYPRFWETMAGDYASPIYRSVANFETSGYLKNIHCPVLSIIGDKDVQVLSALNNPAIELALRDGANENYSVLEMPDINHLFQHCETGLADEYPEIEEPFNSEVLEIIAKWINELSIVKPSGKVLDHYSRQTPFTDPGEFVYLYDDLPKSTGKICSLIKKQLIHPVEARQMKGVLPEGRNIEDGDFPTISDVLAELQNRDPNGLYKNRKPENRLVIACYHHGLLLASILRERGIPVRLRAGFARYYEDQAKVRFGHVICEIWDKDDQQWIWVDPDRNYSDVSTGQFELPAVAWQNFRNDELPDVTYTSSLTQGPQAILHILLLDHAFTLRNERNYWHTPEFLFTDDFSINDLDAERIEIIDRIARQLNQQAKELAELQKIYDENDFIHPQQRSMDTYYEKMTGESLEDLDE